MENRAPYGEGGFESIRSECLKPFKEWVAPTPSEVRTLVKMAGLTGAEVANLVGISGSRTVRRWVGGDVEIPYAVWAILCHKAGLGIIWL